MFADLKFALRQLAKAPGFAAVAILALAIGIATSTTMFTFFNGLLVRPFPFLRDETTLVALRSVDLKNPSNDMPLSIPDISDIRAQAQSFEGTVTLWNRTYILDGAERPRRVLGTWITPDAFQTLGVRPILGRAFEPADAIADVPNVVILGHNVWQTMFGGREDIVGQAITLNRASATVIGVMPAGFRFPEVADMWQPFPTLSNQEEKHRGSRSWPLYARLKPGVTLQQAQSELDTLAARLAAEHPTTNTGFTFKVLTLRDEMTRNIRLQMQLMLAAVFAVLLIACANVANLLLARAATRTREIAIRAALGAGRVRLMRQVLTECVVLSLLGGVAGFILATWEYDLVMACLPQEVPFWLRFDFDWRVLGFAVLVTFGSSLLFGVFPALQISKPEIALELKEGGRSNMAGARGRRARNALVVAQMALALVLLVVAGLTARSFLELHRTDTGIDATQVLTFRTGIPPTMEDDPVVVRRFFDNVTKQLHAIPGVEGAGFVSYLPVSEAINVSTFLPEGALEPKTNQDWPDANVRVATPGAFDVLRVPLLFGRLFNEHDTDDTPGVAIIDQKLAQQHFPNTDPIGKRFTFSEPGPKRKWLTIVGVVGTVRQRPADRHESGGIWLPLSQAPDNFLTGLIRVQGEPFGYLRAAEDAVLAVWPDIPIYNPKTMTDVVSETLWQPRFFGGLFAGFAVIALVLAAIGIYGVTAYSVSQRTQEIGVRMALGAAPGAVVRLIVADGAKLVATVLAIGLAAAWGSARLLTGILHGIEPHDPPTFASVPLLLAVVALAACYLPGRRATLIDPIVALRNE